MHVIAINDLNDKGVVVLNLMDEERKRHEFATLNEAKSFLNGKEVVYAGQFFVGSLYLLPFDDHVPTLKECLDRSGHGKAAHCSAAHNMLDAIEARMCLVEDHYNTGLYSIVDDNLNDIETGERFVLIRNAEGHGYIVRRSLFKERFNSLGE